METDRSLVQRDIETKKSLSARRKIHGPVEGHDSTGFQSMCRRERRRVGTVSGVASRLSLDDRERSSPAAGVLSVVMS
ncbi:hypothetical protein SETIT_1G347400v2 [Setaria italica]|uniref:Uncharacterized protein n=2 Tax=Setaria TaxID=4554 RepID=A0A368PSS3_SETIT|nr:hypothetical protein SETIT_1G347400v2 [Setaria italica]TKW41987.1 hypothetical protein SEVIR_1G354300v2 [Setaria viridis]